LKTSSILCASSIAGSGFLLLMVDLVLLQVRRRSSAGRRAGDG
jgi:hypothetical protein